MGDVFGFAGEFGGFDDEALQQGGVDGPQQEEGGDPDGERGREPTNFELVVGVEEDDRHGRHGGHLDAQGPDGGVHIGVAGPKGHATGRVEQIVLGELVAECPQTKEDAPNDSQSAAQVGGHIGRGELGVALQEGQVAQGIHGQHAEGGKDQQRHEPAPHEVVEGQLEQIKANVAAEDWLNCAVGDAVDEAQHIFPLGAGGRGKGEGEEQPCGGD